MSLNCLLLWYIHGDKNIQKCSWSALCCVLFYGHLTVGPHKYAKICWCPTHHKFECICKGHAWWVCIVLWLTSRYWNNRISIDWIFYFHHYDLILSGFGCAFSCMYGPVFSMAWYGYRYLWHYTLVSSTSSPYSLSDSFLCVRCSNVECH